MKTAVIITGHMRSFDRCLPNLHWHVFRHLPAPDFFVSTIADADAIKAEALRLQYPSARVEVEAVIEQPDCVAEMRAAGVRLPTEFHRGLPYMHEGAPISVHPQAVLRQLWQLQRGADYFWNTAGAAAVEYDLVVRCRPDLWFHSEIKKINPYAHTHFCGVPWWGRFGGVNDRFAIMQRGVMPAYFDTYAASPALMANGAPLHPETLIAANLAAGGAIVAPLFVEFSTVRTTGEMRPPEISFADLAHLHK